MPNELDSSTAYVTKHINTGRGAAEEGGGGHNLRGERYAYCRPFPSPHHRARHHKQWQYKRTTTELKTTELTHLGSVLQDDPRAAEHDGERHDDPNHPRNHAHQLRGAEHADAGEGKELGQRRDGVRQRERRAVQLPEGLRRKRDRHDGARRHEGVERRLHRIPRFPQHRLFFVVKLLLVLLPPFSPRAGYRFPSGGSRKIPSFLPPFPFSCVRLSRR